MVENRAKAVGRLVRHRTFPRNALLQTGVAMGLLALLSWGATQNAMAETFREVTAFGKNPGNLGMFKYVPDTSKPDPDTSKPGPRLPLVVVLHGGGQEAVAYARAAGWPDMAKRCGFALVLPEQRIENNPTRHFNWFLRRLCRPGRQVPIGVEEVQSIMEMIDQMKADHPIDTARVYVTGLSAGGAMTSVLLATHPERFAGGAIIAGLPYGCANDAAEAIISMAVGKEQDPQAWGDLVRGASKHKGPWPKVSIWHGVNDHRVTPANALAIMKQWTNVHGIDQTPDGTELVSGQIGALYSDAAGRPLVELFLVSKMEHGTPVDPGLGAEQGGALIPNVLDADIFSTLQIVKFWGLYNGEL